MSQPKSIQDLSLVRLSFPSLEKLVDLVNLPLERDGVKHEELEDVLRAISRRFERSSLMGRTLDLYTNNRIHLLNNKETVKVPTMLPAWRVGGERGVQAYVNVTPYSPAGGAGDMEARKLFGFLILGAVLIETHAKWDKVSGSTQIAKDGAIVYASMMHKVVDRVTGAGMDRLRSDQIKYVFAKYFLVSMLGRQAGETTDALALGATKQTSVGVLSDFEAKVADAAGKGTQTELYSLGLLDFVTALCKSAPWFSRLTARSFVQVFTSMYQPPALLMAEDAGYFLAMTATHQIGAEIVSGYAFEPVYGKEGDSLVDGLAGAIR